MVFWISVFLFTIAIPLAMLVFGILFIRAAFVGFSANIAYRSRRSRRSKATWSYANKMVGSMLIVFGSIMLPIYSIIMLLTYKGNESFIGLYGGILILCSIIPVLISFLPVEGLLKKNFDIYGKRKKPKD